MAVRDFPGRGKVAVLKTTPDTVLEDYRQLMHLAGYEEALPKDVETILKINVSWQTWYPACSTVPWQLEGVIKTMQDDGYRDLIGAQNNTVVVDAYVAEREIMSVRPSTATSDVVADAGLGILDTACRFSVCGSRWYADYRRRLHELGLSQYFVEQPEDEVYRFGNGTKCASSTRAFVPVVIGGPRLISFSVISLEKEIADTTIIRIVYTTAHMMTIP